MERQGGGQAECDHETRHQGVSRVLTIALEGVMDLTLDTAREIVIMPRRG